MSGAWARASLWGPLEDLHQVEILNGLFLEPFHHLLEHVEGLALVLDERIVLAVAAKADALLQVIHVEEVVFPKRVEDAQHDHALVLAHGFGADDLLFRCVTLFELLENRVAEFLPVERFGLDAFGLDSDAEACEDAVFQALEIPVVNVCLDRAELIDQIAEYSRNVVFEDQVLLIKAFEQAT